MATNFPTSLDSLTNPASSDQLNVPSHSLQHANANDAIEALETKVGINNSGGTTSLDYRVKQLETNPTYTNEEAVDAVASALAAGTHSNITINYNDAGNSISISAAAGYTNEEAVDAVAAALTQSSGISIVYNDSANTITISVDSSVVLKTGATMTGALTLSGAPTSNLHAATKAYVDTATATVTSNSTTTYIPLSSIGVADGVASLNSSGVIPDAQIPAAIARDSEVSSSISTAINNLINSAPGTLDTLGEIATALATSDSAAAALTTVVNGKVSKAGGDIIQSSLSTVIPLVLKGAASQTANLQEWQNSAGTMLARIDANGLIYLPGGSWHLVNNQETWYKNNTSFYQKGASHTFRRQSDEADLLTIGGNGNTSILLNSASAVGLIIKGAASQTANLFETQDSSGNTLVSLTATVSSTNILKFTEAHSFKINWGSRDIFSTASGHLTVTPYDDSRKVLVVKGYASQTANLQEWQNSSGTVLASIKPTGAISFASDVWQTDSLSNLKLLFENTGYTYYKATNHIFRNSSDNEVLKIDNNGALTNTIKSASSIGLIVKGAASQTANLQEWQESAGGLLARVDQNGGVHGAFLNVAQSANGIASNGTYAIRFNGLLLNIGTAQTTGAQLTVTNATTTNVGLVVKGAASQTANLQEWQNSAGTVLASVGPTGGLTTNSTGYSNTALSIVNNSSTVFEINQYGQSWNSTNSTFGNYYNTDGGTLPQVSIFSSATGKKGLIVRGAASQTANLQEWQDSAGTANAFVQVNGNMHVAYLDSLSSLGTYLYTGNNEGFQLVNRDAAHIPLKIKGATSQTANLQEWQNSAGTVLAKVDASGSMFTITPADSTNTTQVATTAYVKSNINNLINSAPGTLDTLGEIATALAASDSAAAALVTSVNLKAPLASPALTGTPTAPTATAGTNTTQLATTAFVKTEITSSVQPGAVYQTSAPSSPAVGQIWIDSDEDVTTFDSNIFNRQSFTATASQTVFTSSVPFIEGYEQVYFNGLMLSRSADYTTSGSNTVTLASGAAVNDIIEIVTITALNAYVASQPVSISANTNLTASKRYFVTSASALTLTLPANPSLNDQIDVVDASGNALTYNITIARNGKLINGLAVNLIIDTAGSFISLLYTGPTYGWRAQ